MWRSIAQAVGVVTLVLCGVLYQGGSPSSSTVRGAIRYQEETFIGKDVLTIEERRRLDSEPIDFGEEITRTSNVVAGTTNGSSITWLNSNVTAFLCDVPLSTGPVQVLHQEPIPNHTIQTVFFSFDSTNSSGFFRMDNYDADLNKIIANRGQPDRVNAAGMYFDTDANRSNFPLAAFLFNEPEVQVEGELSTEIFLCRYDVFRVECFNFTLFRFGRFSNLPFAGFVFNTSYFYGNGVGHSDENVSTGDYTPRPLFTVRNVNEEYPDRDETEYYIQYAENRAMRCADLTGLNQDDCVDATTGETTDCIVANRLRTGSVSTAVSAARGFLTCVANSAIGIILISLDGTLTPYAYLFIQGVDLAILDDNNQVTEETTFPPVTNDARTRVIPNRNLSTSIVTPKGDVLGQFGACYSVEQPRNITGGRSMGRRVYCSSNNGHGLWEIATQGGLEVGYCNDYWNDILNEPITNANIPTCRRFCSTQCPECCDDDNNNQIGAKPQLIYIVESAQTFRNDGLNCHDTTQSVATRDVFLEPSTLPTPMPTPQPNAMGMRADPFVIGPHGSKTQFWLPLGKFLSVFVGPDGSEIFVRCFGKPGTHSQWIDGLVIKQNGVIVVDVVVKLHGQALLDATLQRRSTEAETIGNLLDFVDVKIDGQTVQPNVATNDRAFKSIKGDALVEFAKHNYPILDKLGDSITITTEGFKLELFTMPARKYKDEFEAAKWTHIDFKFLHVPDSTYCSGFLADVMFGTDTVDPGLKAAWLKKPGGLLEDGDYDVEAPEVLAGETNVVYS